MKYYEYCDNAPSSTVVSYGMTYENDKTIKLKVAGMFVAISLLINIPYSITKTNCLDLQEITKPCSPISLHYQSDIGNGTITLRSEYDSARKTLDAFDELCPGWDGDNAIAPISLVINNAKKFIFCLSNYGYQVPTDIEPTPYGSIVMDFDVDRGLVSVEIGMTKIGWFTDFEDGHNYASEGLECDFNTIPQSLESLFS